MLQWHIVEETVWQVPQNHGKVRKYVMKICCIPERSPRNSTKQFLSISLRAGGYKCVSELGRPWFRKCKFTEQSPEPIKINCQLDHEEIFSQITIFLLSENSLKNSFANHHPFRCSPVYLREGSVHLVYPLSSIYNFVGEMEHMFWYAYFIKGICLINMEFIPVEMVVIHPRD